VVKQLLCVTDLARRFHCHHVLFSKWLNNSCAWLAWQGDFIVTMSYSVSKICRPRGEAESSYCKGILLLVDLCWTSTVVLQSDCTQRLQEWGTWWIQGRTLAFRNQLTSICCTSTKACSPCQVIACGGFYLKHASKLQFVLTAKTSCFSSPKKEPREQILDKKYPLWKLCSVWKGMAADEKHKSTSISRSRWFPRWRLLPNFLWKGWEIRPLESVLMSNGKFLHPLESVLMSKPHQSWQDGGRCDQVQRNCVLQYNIRHE